MTNTLSQKENLNSALFFLENLMLSSHLDQGYLARDCMESFDDYKWVPVVGLTYTERQRWRELKEQGLDGELTLSELTEFLDFTDVKEMGDSVHAFALSHHAKKLILSVKQNDEETPPAEENALSDSEQNPSEDKSLSNHLKSLAASCVFDLEGDLNIGLSEKMSGEKIFDSVTESGSTLINFDDESHQLKGYFDLDESDTLALMEDIHSGLEAAVGLVGTGNALKGKLIDLDAKAEHALSMLLPAESSDALASIMGKDHFGEVREEHIYQVNASLGSALSVVVTNFEGVPELQLEIDVCGGVPAVHFNLVEDDTLLHAYVSQGGILLTPDADDADFVSPDSLDSLGASSNSILLKEV